MSIKELLDNSIEHKQLDLQVLIMFLALEKQVIDMDGSIDQLDLYFLPQHKERMNKELNDYKEKMNMKYPSSCYIVQTDNGNYLVHVQEQFMINRLLRNVKRAWYISKDELIYEDGIKKVKDLITNENQIIGRWKH